MHLRGAIQVYDAVFTSQDVVDVFLLKNCPLERLLQFPISLSRFAVSVDCRRTPELSKLVSQENDHCVKVSEENGVYLYVLEAANRT